MNNQAFLNDLYRFTGASSYEEALKKVIDEAGTEIVNDMRVGRVPDDCPDFATLHDFVDANKYGGAFNWPGPLPSEQEEGYAEAFCAFWNAVQGELDRWLKEAKP